MRSFDSARLSILGPTRSFSANRCRQAHPPGDFGKFKPRMTSALCRSHVAQANSPKATPFDVRRHIRSSAR
jgi:hypothetical protein